MKKLKKFRKLIIVFFGSLFIFSCSTVSKYSSAKTLEITPTIVQKPTIADIQVDEKKVTGTSTGKATITPIETIQNEAVASALKTAKADILVEPRFDTTIDGGKTTVVVSGFPATYKNFRTMKNEDIPLMQTGSVVQVNTFTPPTVTTKKPKYGKAALITLGVAAAVLFAVSGSE